MTETLKPNAGMGLLSSVLASPPPAFVDTLPPPSERLSARAGEAVQFAAPKGCRVSFGVSSGVDFQAFGGAEGTLETKLLEGGVEAKISLKW